MLSKDLLKKMRATGDLGTAPRCSKMLEAWRDEAAMPALYYGMDELSRKTKLAPPKLVEFVQHLEDEGAKASRTHLDPKGFRTDLEARELLAAYKDYARRA
jgi:tRNA (guanine26-N2/guanine27-N2)-dimethyltransferase